MCEQGTHAQTRNYGVYTPRLIPPQAPFERRGKSVSDGLEISAIDGVCRERQPRKVGAFEMAGVLARLEKPYPVNRQTHATPSKPPPHHVAARQLDIQSTASVQPAPLPCRTQQG